MTKHTPGPWHVVEKAEHKGQGILHIVEEGGDPYWDIATLMTHDEELEANARLIAAAPELLEAAQKALDECVDLIGTDEGEALEAAIKKALGEQ